MWRDNSIMGETNEFALKFQFWSVKRNLRIDQSKRQNIYDHDKNETNIPKKGTNGHLVNIVERG